MILLEKVLLKNFLINRNYRVLECLLTLIFIFYISACSPKPLTIQLKVNKQFEKNWENILKINPLPDNYLFSTKIMDDKTLPELNIGSFRSEIKPISDNMIIINRYWSAPVTDFWDSATNINSSDIQDYNILPLDNIKLPQKALSIDGLYPGETNYPAYTTEYLYLDFPEDPETEKIYGEKLLIWFNKIKAIFNESKAGPNISWIGSVGDMMLQRGVETILLYSDNGSDIIFGDTLDILQNQDLLLGNLEGSVTYSNIKTLKSYNFKFDPNVLFVLKDIGFDYFSLTNNHIYDYGEKGFRDTLNNLRNAEILTSGAGLTEEAAAEYTEINLNNNLVRILSLGAYPEENNGWDGESMAQVTATRPGILFNSDLALNAVSKMSTADSFDILMIHGGREWTSAPYEDQKKLYRKYLDAGADVIIGSHPHVLQGMEEWNGKLIAYSLGNFIFPGMGAKSYAEESIILSFGIIDNEIKYIEPISVKINNRTISVDKTDRILDRFINLTKDLIGR
jgi:poly-gamma-glutamate capsule biosynthesis protein CapA/YwtB (metallophosphatase superfamily)